MTLDRLETIARAAELDWDAVLATGQVTTDSNADYIAAMSPTTTLALIGHVRRLADLYVRRSDEMALIVRRLAAADALHHTGVAMGECDHCLLRWPCPTHLAVHPECADGCEHTP